MLASAFKFILSLNGEICINFYVNFYFRNVFEKN